MLQRVEQADEVDDQGIGTGMSIRRTVVKPGCSLAVEELIPEHVVTGRDSRKQRQDNQEDGHQMPEADTGKRAFRAAAVQQQGGESGYCQQDPHQIEQSFHVLSR